MTRAEHRLDAGTVHHFANSDDNSWEDHDSRMQRVAGNTGTAIHAVPVFAFVLALGLVSEIVSVVGPN